MDPIRRAVWFIESHFANEITLDEIAAVAGVTKFHLCRVFRLVTGYSPLGYVRERRLSVAARQLATGCGSILGVALDACYASQEAFTRAFHERFGCTPESLKSRQNLETLSLTEAMNMSTKHTIELDVPRMEQGRAMRIAGIREHYVAEENVRIPSQWQRFAPYIGNVPSQKGHENYGVIEFEECGEMNYTAGVEVTGGPRLISPLVAVDVPEQFYAVFTHTGHISAIRCTFDAIWNDWFPSSDLKPTKGTQFERYDERFNPSTGEGQMEIWVPVQK